MTIKTATKTAAVGVALGLAFGLLYPYALNYFAFGDMTAVQRALLFRTCQSIHLVVTHGSVLFFLLVLASKQKEQA